MFVKGSAVVYSILCDGVLYALGCANDGCGSNEFSGENMVFSVVEYDSVVDALAVTVYSEYVTAFTLG